MAESTVIYVDICKGVKFLYNAIIDAPTSWVGQVNDYMPFVKLLIFWDGPESVYVCFRDE